MRFLAIVLIVIALVTWNGFSNTPLFNKSSSDLTGALTVTGTSSNADSPLGSNLSAIRDWSTELAFVDVFKTSRSWIPQCVEWQDPDCTSGWDTGEYDLIDLDDDGWVRWFTLPHMATDEYVTQFATLVRDNLNSSRRVYVEYSNEVWNGTFSQGDWVEQQGETEWPGGPHSGYTKRINWYGKRTAEICDFWKSVWGAESDRVVCVMASQAANSWTASEALACPLWTAGAPCADHGIDALAIAPYFGGYLGDPFHETELEGWTSDPDGGLGRLFGELTPGGVLAGGPPDGALQETYGWMADNAAVASSYGLDLIAYEGGQHLVGYFGVENNDAITTLFQNANRNTRMGGLYTQYLAEWRNQGGRLFTHFTNAGSYSKWGSWGTLEYIDQAGSPKYDALMAFIAANPCWWPDCSSGSVEPTTTATPTPTRTPSPTATPTATPTPTPTGTVDPGLTTIEIRDQVSVSQVKPFGIVVGWRDRWGAGQIVKNIIENPGFEARLFRSIIHANEGATGRRVPQAFWDTSWNNDQWGIGQPQGFWNGAEYEIIYGPAKGRTGTVTNFTHENNQNVFYLDSDGVAAEQWDAMIVRTERPGVNAWGYAYSADTTTVRSGSPGSQSLHLTYPAESWQAAYAFYMDSSWRDIDPSSGKLMIVQGNWHLEFWAKGGSDGDQLRVRFFREDEADFIDETITLTAGWQKIERDVFIAAGTDPVRSYAPDEYHPILGFAFYIRTTGDEAWVDDLALYRSDDTNPTVFTDTFVNRLKELGPGILRDWDDHQMGNTLDNELAVPWARKTVNYNPGEREAYNFAYSLHEFMQLCQEVGAEPWHIVPPTSSPADLVNLIEYLAGPADGAHPYADRRAALGQSTPWTDVFPMIHLEFGNELWGTASSDDPYFGASLMNGARLGQIAHERFGILKSSPYYDPTQFNLIIGGQAGWTPRQQEIEGNSSNHDTIGLAPYFQFTLDRYGSDEEIFYPTFAQPFDNVTSGIMRESKNYIDGFGQGTGLAIYELNFHTTGGDLPIATRNDLVTGMAGIALPLHMLVYLRDMGVKNQTAFGVHGFSTRWMMESSGYVRIWGMLRDLEVTGRKRPTWLGVEIVNKAVQGDLLTTAQSGANPSWHQMPFNGVLNEIDVSYVQSFAFRDGDSYSVVLFNLSLDESQRVRLDLPAPPQSQATRYELSSASIHDDNEDAENVSIQTTQLTDFTDGYGLILPAHSVTVITWTAQPCYDVTGDDQVDVADIQAVTGRWQARKGGLDYLPEYDVNNDDVIDVVDIVKVAKAWGTACSKGGVMHDV